MGIFNGKNSESQNSDTHKEQLKQQIIAERQRRQQQVECDAEEMSPGDADSATTGEASTTEESGVVVDSDVGITPADSESGTPEATETTQMFHPARWIIPLVALLACIAVWLAMHHTLSNRKDTLEQQQADIHAAQGELDQTRADADKQYAQVVSDSTDGLDVARKQADDDKVRGLVQEATTWTGIEDYLKKRDKVMKDYDLDENSQFMTEFLPGEQEGLTRTDPSGKTHYVYDADIHAEFEDFQSWVTGAEGSIYHYNGLVSMKILSDSGQATDINYALLTYDTINGKLTNLQAHTLPSGLQQSG